MTAVINRTEVDSDITCYDNLVELYLSCERAGCRSAVAQLQPRLLAIMLRSLLLLYVMVCTLTTFAPSHARRVIRAVPGTSTTGFYIVKLSDSVTHDQFETTLQQATSMASESKVYEKVEGDVAKIFTMRLSHDEADNVSKKVDKMSLL